MNMIDTAIFNNLNKAFLDSIEECLNFELSQLNVILNDVNSKAIPYNKEKHNFAVNFMDGDIDIDFKLRIPTILDNILGDDKFQITIYVYILENKVTFHWYTEEASEVVPIDPIYYTLIPNKYKTFESWKPMKDKYLPLFK